MVKRITNSSSSTANRQTRQSVHRVRRGENLSRIAKKHGLSLQQLLDANPQIKNPNHIRIGQEIHLPQQRPGRSTTADTKKAAKAPAPAQTSQIETKTQRNQRQKQQQDLAQKKQATPQHKTGGLPQKNGTLGLLQSKKELL